jgi:hypothetical protein
MNKQDVDAIAAAMRKRVVAVTVTFEQVGGHPQVKVNKFYNGSSKSVGPDDVIYLHNELSSNSQVIPVQVLIPWGPCLIDRGQDKYTLASSTPMPLLVKGKDIINLFVDATGSKGFPYDIQFPNGQSAFEGIEIRTEAEIEIDGGGGGGVPPLKAT